MQRLLISSAVGLGLLFGSLAPTFVPRPAQAFPIGGRGVIRAPDNGAENAKFRQERTPLPLCELA